MAYYHVCPNCGAHLDPCEICDCDKKRPPQSSSSETAQKTEIAQDFNLSLSYREGVVKR